MPLPSQACPGFCEPGPPATPWGLFPEPRAWISTKPAPTARASIVMNPPLPFLVLVNETESPFASRTTVAPEPAPIFLLGLKQSKANAGPAAPTDKTTASVPPIKSLLMASFPSSCLLFLDRPALPHQPADAGLKESPPAPAAARGSQPSPIAGTPRSRWHTPGAALQSESNQSVGFPTRALFGPIPVAAR